MAQYKGWGTAIGVASHRQVNCPPCFVTNFIEVEVDTYTGEIKTTRAVAAVDCGTPINPDLAAGQLEGGLCRGIGLALLESTDYDPETGRLTCGGTFIDYKFYTPVDMPPVDKVKTFFADTYESSGPFWGQRRWGSCKQCNGGSGRQCHLQCHRHTVCRSPGNAGKSF